MRGEGEESTYAVTFREGKRAKGGWNVGGGAARAWNSCRDSAIRHGN